MSKQYELIVFDWDGTLMDSESRIVACMQAAVEDAGAEPISNEAVKGIIGLELGKAVQTLYPEGDAEFVQKMVDRYRHHYIVQDKTPSPLFEGVEATLQQLHDRGLLLAVATGKGRRGLDKVLDETGLRPLFHTTRCADEAFSKPHPDMLEQILAEMGVEPQAALMIGDTSFDLQMAQSAKVDAVAVSFGVQHCDNLLQYKPLLCVDSIPDLLQWLDEVNAVSAAE